MKNEKDGAQVAANEIASQWIIGRLFVNGTTERIAAIIRKHCPSGDVAKLCEALEEMKDERDSWKTRHGAVTRENQKIIEAFENMVAADPITNEQRHALAYYAATYLARGVHGVWHPLATGIAALLKHCEALELAHARKSQPETVNYRMLCVLRDVKNIYYSAIASHDFAKAFIGSINMVALEEEICAAESAAPSMEAKIEVLKYAASICDSKNLSMKTPAYRAACDEIKTSLLASVERLEAGERMEAVAYVTDAPSMEADLAEALRMVLGTKDEPLKGACVRLPFNVEKQIKDVLARYTLKTEGWM